MSITDELREYALGWDERNRVRRDLTAIADRIDTEHEKRIASVMNDALYHANEKDMADLGWIRLPKDANGEYIHEHDKVDWRDHAGTWHENATVVAVCNDGCYVMDGTVFHVHKSDIRHHHAPTVEDVLREFAGTLASAENNWGSDVNDAIAKYAAKLQLKEPNE